MFDVLEPPDQSVPAPLLEATDTQFVVFDSLTDDTVTVFRGTGFIYANGIVIGGTITAMEWTHRDGNGDRLLQSAAHKSRHLEQRCQHRQLAEHWSRAPVTGIDGQPSSIQR
ncbi:MAG: hypothetical protein U1E49_00650 [Hyphomicrobiaceae bacterium]